MQKLVLLAMLVFPWLSLFFINKNSLKRFMPVSILASLLVTIVFEIGYVYNWWKVMVILAPWDAITSVPLTYGVFLVGTIWVFHFSYDMNLGSYIVLNLLMDAFYSFVALNILTWIGIYRLDNMKNLGIFFLMTLIAYIIYPYQKWQDTVMDKEPL